MSLEIKTFRQLRASIDLDGAALTEILSEWLITTYALPEGSHVSVDWQIKGRAIAVRLTAMHTEEIPKEEDDGLQL